MNRFPILSLSFLHFKNTRLLGFIDAFQHQRVTKLLTDVQLQSFSNTRSLKTRWLDWVWNAGSLVLLLVILTIGWFCTRLLVGEWLLTAKRLLLCLESLLLWLLALVYFVKAFAVLLLLVKYWLDIHHRLLLDGRSLLRWNELVKFCWRVSFYDSRWNVAFVHWHLRRQQIVRWFVAKIIILRFNLTGIAWLSSCFSLWHISDNCLIRLSWKSFKFFWLVIGCNIIEPEGLILAVLNEAWIWSLFWSNKLV